MQIGVYICLWDDDILSTLDIELVIKQIKRLPDVSVIRDCSNICSVHELRSIVNEVKNYFLNRLLILTCNSFIDDSIFKSIFENTQLEKEYLKVINLNEQLDSSEENIILKTQKTIELLETKISELKQSGYPDKIIIKSKPATLVIGGGIGGIESALILADSGYKVYLLEKRPGIGGNARKINRVYPTLTQSHSVIAPKMLAAIQNSNIEILSWSEIEEMKGTPGDYKIKIRSKSRYVNPEFCNACGKCKTVCPINVPDEFNERMNTRKVIYQPFKGSIPETFLIDKGEMPPCRGKCPIDQDAPGYIDLIRTGKYHEAFDLIRLKNPLPSVIARICPGNCEDVCRRGLNERPVSIKKLKQFVTDWAFRNGKDASLLRPAASHKEKVAVIGSGPAGLSCAHDLSTRGYNVSVFEESSKAGGLLVSGIPCFRIPAEIIRYDIEQIKKAGVIFKFNTKIGEKLTLKDLRTEYDAVFIATGAQKTKKIGIQGETAAGCFDALTFLQRYNSGEKIVLGEKVLIIGGDNSAVYSAVAAKNLGSKYIQIIFSGDENSLNIDTDTMQLARENSVQFLFNTKIEKIVVTNGRVSGVEYFRTDSQTKIIDTEDIVLIKSLKLEKIESDTILLVKDRESDLGFNRATSLRVIVTSENLVFVNPETLETNTEGIFAGGDVVVGSGSVMKAVSDGKRAAASIDQYLRHQPMEQIIPARLINKESLKHASENEQTYPGCLSKSDCKNIVYVSAQSQEVLSESGAVQEAERCLQCGVCIDCWECSRICEQHAIDHEMKDLVRNIDVGSIIIATGYSLFNPEQIKRLGYKTCENVLTAMEFERLCSKDGPTEGKIVLKNGKKPETVAVIHCVGSRDCNYLEYCSDVCCTYSMKLASEIRDKTSAEVYEFYIDIRGCGKDFEKFYSTTRKKGIKFIRGKVAEITSLHVHQGEKEKLIINCEDTLMGRILRITADMVILATAMEPSEDSAEIAGLFNLKLDDNGFYAVNQSKLPHIFTSVHGIYVVGTCQRPQTIHDTITQSHAAAAAIISSLQNNR